MSQFANRAYLLQGYRLENAVSVPFFRLNLSSFVMCLVVMAGQNYEAVHEARSRFTHPILAAALRRGLVGLPSRAEDRVNLPLAEMDVAPVIGRARSLDGDEAGSRVGSAGSVRFTGRSPAWRCVSGVASWDGARSTRDTSCRDLPVGHLVLGVAAAPQAQSQSGRRRRFPRRFRLSERYAGPEVIAGPERR